MDENTISVKWPIIRWREDGPDEAEDEIATEYPLTVRLDGEEFATMVCSPTDLEDLVVGFLASEGVIRTMSDIRDFTVDAARGFTYVELQRPQSSAKNDHSKRFIGSCCGKSRQFYFQNDARTARTITGGPSISVDCCFQLMRQLQDRSADFRNTGGVHNAAFGEVANGGTLAAVRTDIGRHNALDKLNGYAIRNGLPTREYVIAFSGRLSSEVVLKAAKIGCAVLLSKSAPTDLALKLADDLGITCVGFIRNGTLNVYTHSRRIIM